MAWLHTWSGLVLGWLLFTIFLAGTASYFREEISRYARPEIAPAALDLPRAADAAQRFMAAHATHASNWFINLPDPRNPAELSVFWRDAAGEAHSHAVDVRTGQAVAARDTRGGDFFYRLHFDLHYLSARMARWIVGCAAMMMLVAIVSGVITHRRIFKDFFTFRAGKGQRSWLDAHNALAVLSLPYHLVITYTGLITLMFMYMPWGISTQYGENTAPFFDTVFAQTSDVDPAGRSAPLASLGAMVVMAEREWRRKGESSGPRASGSASVGSVAVHHPGDAQARVVMRQRNGREVALSVANAEFDHAGRLLASRASSGGATTTREVLYGLHLGRFAEPGLRWLLFLTGLAGTAMVGTGLIMWNVKRAGRGRASAGERVVGALNVGVVAGLPLAMAGFFWANRLLPLNVPQRADWEIHSFFIVWAAALVMAFVRSDRRGWRWQLDACGIAFAGIPLLSALTTGRGLPDSLADGDGFFAAFDLALLVFAGVFFAGARLLARDGSRRTALTAAARTGV